MAGPTIFCSSISYGWTYDVFLSFRGEDTRYSFTGNLYKALEKRGIRTFIDDEELQRGDGLTAALEKAIEESRIAIVVLSSNYASSSFCLNELAHILKCINGKGRLVLPIFYDVDPSGVRHQRNLYGKALARHKKRLKDDNKVQNWRKALHQVANLSGWHFKHGNKYEYEFIEKIVKEVSRKIKRVALPVADYPVGLDSHVQHVISLLDVGSDHRVLMVGIYGIGGIGKTTLAAAVYNSIADCFGGLCFLESVREKSNKHELVDLQKLLLLELLGEKEIELAGVRQGISIVQQRLQRKKVLLILDDVDNLQQLEALVGGSNWFGFGSRVLITTRDKHLLAKHGVEKTYQLNELNQKDALQLLSWKAFKTEKYDPSYMDVLNCVVTYASGLPLALVVMGSNLFGKSIQEWESALDRYKRIPDKQIQKILQVSFDTLNEDEQSVFLDIACCLKGYRMPEVEDILRAHYANCMKYQIGVLVEKSLINLGFFGKVTLHDLIEVMGKEIVRKESPHEPGERSRLWFHKEIVQVLEENTGTGKIEIIRIDFPILDKVAVDWDGEAFKKIKNIKTLIIKSGHFSKGPKHLPNSLRVLEWWGYPSQYLPDDFHPKNLAICTLPDNCLASFQLASILKKEFTNLRALNLDFTKCLTEIPDVSGLVNLEKLSFEYCENLIAVHSSVGSLNKLKILNAFNCTKLRSFPPIKLTSLEKLILSFCRSLESFPEILGKMENIKKIDLDGCPIKELPFSFRNLTGLQRLYLSYSGKFSSNGCHDATFICNIVMMPELVEIIAWGWEGWVLPKEGEFEKKLSSIMCPNLERLYVRNCNLSDDFFTTTCMWFANVKDLDLSRNNFTNLPECIKDCYFLRKLNLDYCKHLQEIRGIPPNLEHFCARYCKSLSSTCTSMLLNQELHKAGNTLFFLPVAKIPEWFEHQSCGPSISFWCREKLPAIALCLALGPMHRESIMLRAIMIINGNKKLCDEGIHAHCFSMGANHICLFDLQKIRFKYNLDKVLLKNKWNHVEVSYEAMDANHIRLPALKCGIHVFEQNNIIEYAQFTDPQKIADSQ